MSSVFAHLQAIQARIEALKEMAAPPMPRPWTATHKHATTGLYAREITRALHMGAGHDIVVYEVLGAPTGFQRRADSAFDFERQWMVLGKAVA